MDAVHLSSFFSSVFQPDVSARSGAAHTDIHAGDASMVYYYMLASGERFSFGNAPSCS